MERSESTGDVTDLKFESRATSQSRTRPYQLKRNLIFLPFARQKNSNTPSERRHMSKDDENTNEWGNKLDQIELM